MTPSERAKELCCDSLAEVSRVSGVSQRTLINWYKSKPWLFDAVCEKVSERVIIKTRRMK